MNIDWSPVTMKTGYDTVTTYDSIQNDRTKSNSTYWKLDIHNSLDNATQIYNQDHEGLDTT